MFIPVVHGPLVKSLCGDVSFNAVICKEIINSRVKLTVGLLSGSICLQLSRSLSINVLICSVNRYLGSPSPSISFCTLFYVSPWLIATAPNMVPSFIVDLL